MMRNSINSYLTSLVMVLALLLSANAFATETVQSTIEIDGKDYTLFTGFTATAGTAGFFSHTRLVDGDFDRDWFLSQLNEHFSGGESDPAFVEFYSEKEFIPKGYILSCENEKAGAMKPKVWKLKAKLNQDEEWTVIHSSEEALGAGIEFNISVNNSDSKRYKYFRFEVNEAASDGFIDINELQLFGYDDLTYTRLTPQVATCTQQGVLRTCYYRNDGKYFEDENGETELAVDACVIAMLSHVLEHHEASANNIEYWKCSICGKYFSDSDGKNEIDEDLTRIVSYIDSDGTNKQLSVAATKVTGTMTTWDAGWYIVSGDVGISERITVNGEVHLILADGATLNANSGITVSASAGFNVYAQSTNDATMGKLVAKAGTKYYAGIGGIDRSNAGSITINGGRVTAIGYDGAGIGSGYYGTVGTITINDGVVDAKDNHNGDGAGIGGGLYGIVNAIDIKGGVIQSRGVGLGTTVYGNPYCGNINIYDGVKSLIVSTKSDGKGLVSTESITFYSGNSAVDGDAKNAVFYDAEKDGVKEIRSIAKNHLVTIVDASKAHVGSSVLYAYAGETVTLTPGVSAKANTLKVNDGTNDLELTVAGVNKYTFVMPNNDVIVTAEVLQTYSISLPIGMKIVSSSTESDATGKYVTGTEIKFKAEFPYSTSNVSDGSETLTAVDGVYSVVVDDSDITITADITRNTYIDLAQVAGEFTVVDGDVLSGETNYTIHIADDATVTLSDAIINSGIVCEGSAIITLVGENNVTGASTAGIQVGGEGTVLTIKGDGSLTAKGDILSAGIGLSKADESDAIGGDIIIEGGYITTIGFEKSAGIGTGAAFLARAKLGNITIKGGVVKAIGGEDADGIGIGYAYRGSSSEIGSVTIYDTAEFVDASSIIDGVVYKHIDGESETDVSANPDPFFHIDADGDRRFILPIAEVADVTYTGKEITPSLINIKEGADYEYSYSNNINVGTATVTVTFRGEYDWVKPVTKSFNITRATPTVIPPTSANSKYTGTCVALVTAGTTDFGTMLYSLDDDDDYSENIPCADKGGDYTVYYKVEESDNWSGAAGSVEIQVPVRVDVTVVGDGSVSGYDPDEFYPVGTVLTLTAEPADGYKFLSWNSDVDVPATFEYTVDAEQNSLEATFSNRYIAYTTSDGDTALPQLSSMYDIKKNKCEDGLCVMFLGDGVTELESGAFHGNKRLTSIEIPSSIETIGHAAFAETPLIRVDMKSKVPPQLGEWMTFYSVPDEYLIHVPHGSADAYRSADGWKDYKDHIVDHDASMLVWNDDAVVPTCSETGWEAGYICNECHKRFADVDGHVEMSPVAALGTTYGAACIYNDDSKAIIDGNSETSVLLPWNIDVDAIELNRTFAAGTISTITLPFSMYVENVEGAVFYRFKYVSSDDWTVHVGSVRDELIANTPYLVKTTGETISFKTGATLERTLDASPTDQGQDEGDGWELRGTYGKMVWKEGHPDLGYVYGFAAENVADVHIGEFVKATAGANLPPMRAYLYYNPVATPAPSPEPSFRGMAPMARSTSSIETPNYLDVVVDDDEGGTLYIGKLNTRTGEFNAAGERWFDMKGRKLNGKPSAKGSYFNNRSKVIVK
ncbi:MAG: leucine-rich repeat protein [Fibrobacter sp.]|nr:leucine-rich repeat protein [Fibrobacter sp.]